MTLAFLAGCEPRRSTRRLPRILQELVVDSFAGGGGVSLAIECALGRGPDIAINHDPDAIAMHETNHPHTRHFCENVWDVDPLEATHGTPVGLAWFSPDCRHFSRAKGGKPVEKRIRGLAWIVLRWAAKVSPRTIILENVREFAEWGPLNRGRRPIKAKIGVTFQRWVQQLRDLGYAVEWRVLNAAGYGAPTHRRRLFVIARRDGQPITWPKPTHGPGRLPYRTAAECIDWSIPTQSIFGRKKPLAPKTMRRIMEGLRRYVIDCPNPYIAPVGPAFLAKFRGTKGSLGVNEPLHTICAGAATFALVVPYLTMLSHTGGNGHRVFPITEPSRTTISKNEHMLCTAFLVKYYGTATGAPVNEPLHTITGKQRFGLVTVAHHKYQIADIGMRMLTSRELARCQGFPDEYVLTGSAENQVARIGNSVPPPLAEAIIRANVELRAIRHGTRVQRNSVDRPTPAPRQASVPFRTDVP